MGRFHEENSLKMEAILYLWVVIRLKQDKHESFQWKGADASPGTKTLTSSVIITSLSASAFWGVTLIAAEGMGGLGCVAAGAAGAAGAAEWLQWR